MKIVINDCYGGFGLSPEAYVAYLKRQNKEAFFYVPDTQASIYTRCTVTDLKNKPTLWFLVFTKDFGEYNTSDIFKNSEQISDLDIDRNDPDLVAVVEDLTPAQASAPLASLKVVEIPDDVEWEIEDYDGNEWVAEKHRVWK